MLPYGYYSEIIQTAAAHIGFALAIWAVWDARKDEAFWLAELNKERAMGRASIPTEARYSIAKVHTASELATIVAQVTFLAIGLSGIFLAPPDGHARLYDSELLGIAISRYGMTFVTMVLTFKSIIRRRGRITYIKTIRRRDDGTRTDMPSGMAPSQSQTHRTQEDEHS